MILTSIISHIGAWIAPWAPMIVAVFLTISPITSYGDTLLTIIRNRSSQGFSVDLCAIMLISSTMRVFFWLGRPFDVSLLLQALVMIVTQCGLLYVALKYRGDSTSWLPGPSGDSTIENIEMQNLNNIYNVDDLNRDNESLCRSTDSSSISQRISYMTSHRPFNFWQWKVTSRYWHFLLRFTAILAGLHFLLGTNEKYIAIIGFTGLLIESTLPIPQILTIRRHQSVDGFRISLLASWLGGDISKLAYFMKGGSDIAPQFIICGLVQTSFDIIVALHYVYYRFLKSPSSDLSKSNNPLIENIEGHSGSSAGPTVDIHNDRRRRLSLKQGIRDD